jgi:DNA-binding GntR family transcriptional regulator
MKNDAFISGYNTNQRAYAELQVSVTRVRDLFIRMHADYFIQILNHAQQ